ncbi:transposase [Leptospira santarosai str. MOR084]|uniref:Transposase n=1 Tax=Leptospira santarosai str. MOR084 TaxID=1049984 RepID=A0A0E2BCP6_9LEPT|nr:transposase [Leptospira santarosai str. MOR084]
MINWLNPNDVVDLEAGSQSFRIAKSILNKGIQVIVLNPGDLATIYQSLKKTDKEDSLKIARLIQRYPMEELPTVPVPTDEEEDNRRLCTEQENWTRQLTQGKNRLHSLFTQAGLTEITKKHLRTKSSRETSVTFASQPISKGSRKNITSFRFSRTKSKTHRRRNQRCIEKESSLCSNHHVYAGNWKGYFSGNHELHGRLQTILLR